MQYNMFNRSYQSFPATRQDAFGNTWTQVQPRARAGTNNAFVNASPASQMIPANQDMFNDPEILAFAPEPDSFEVMAQAGLTEQKAVTKPSSALAPAPGGASDASRPTVNFVLRQEPGSEMQK